MNDIRQPDDKAFDELIEEYYPFEVFQTIRTRKGRQALLLWNWLKYEAKTALLKYENFTRC